MTDETKLLPCPFCGGEAFLRDDVSHSTAFFIGCTTEECFGEIHWAQTGAEAVASWNTRATLAASIPADPVTNASCCQAVRAERDDLRAKQAQMEEVVSSYRTALLEFGIDGSKGSGK